ncbi:dephospho-CoA kinase [bacterium]|nr:dephospho-CoA kinase [bacterium]
MLSKKIAIGLTGSFGSGKSTALKIFKEFGYKTYSADEQVNKLYEDERIQKEIKKIAPEVFSKKETGRCFLEKQKLREAVFSDLNKLKKIETLIHPIIKMQCISLIKSSNKKNIFEIPILVNSGIEKHFTKIITIESRKELRQERIIKRYKHKISVEDFLKIDQSQPTQAERESISNIIINNNGTISEFKKIITSLAN